MSEEQRELENSPLAGILLAHIDQMRAEQREFQEEMRKFVSSAYPDGDIDGHKSYHAALIEREKRRAKLWDAVIEKSLAGFVWFLLVTVGIALWNYLKFEIKK